MDESSLPGVGAEEIERARAPLARAWTLPPAAYVRPDIYDLEVERILRRSWAPLARTDQAPEPGDYIIVHAGFALRKLEPEDAEETLRLLREILEHARPEDWG